MRRHVSILIGAATGLAWLTSAAWGEDTVVVRGPQTAEKITLHGIVEDYTGSELTLRPTANGPHRIIPSRDVIEIATPQHESHKLGIKLLTQGKAAEAGLELETAMKQETRIWVRREILATLVRIGLRQGDFVSAGACFQSLFSSDPTTRHFGLIPLLWGPEIVTGPVHDEARTWLLGKNESGRLIGASLLYADNDWGRDARNELKKLASSGDPRIHVLAQMQSWRDEAHHGNPGKLQTAQWQRRIDELPDDLRAGPNYLLGQAYQARHDYELAAATLLWLPLVDDHDHRLTARACYEAGAALDKIGRLDDARVAYQEVIDRFGETPAAQGAAAALAVRRGNR